LGSIAERENIEILYRVRTMLMPTSLKLISETLLTSNKKKSDLGVD